MYLNVEMFIMREKIYVKSVIISTSNVVAHRAQ